MDSPENAQSSAGSRSLTKELFSWKAPVRPFKRRNKEFFTTVLAIALLLSIIFFTISGIMPVIVIFSLVFLVYILSTISPEEVEHKITNKGVVFAGKQYYWTDLLRFWFVERFGSSLLVLETTKLPGRLEMVVDPQEKEKIKGLLVGHIDLEEAAPSFMDKTAAWLSRRVPLD
ncbi:MAG: hypothetical protein HYU80_00705 [Candidatus Blackburnbacteria bacterium]|nr:hypothetical protein [Candidatus Blackburnbacteria bacterium]